MSLNLKKHKNDLLFIPLGGAGEIGINCNLYQIKGKWLLVDLGIGFARNIPGVKIILPDISFIKKYKNSIRGLIITHIHEDHLGAIQYLWEELRVKIYASAFAAKFLKEKLSEYPFAQDVEIYPVQDKLNLDPFEIEFVQLTHSVPEMQALIIKTCKGNVLHTGDWKFDPNPVVGTVSEKEKIKKYADKNEILAIVCDSTNSLNPGISGSEGDIYKNIKEIVENSEKMVVVTTFASNIARLSTISNIAKECNRKVVISGYSLNRLLSVSKESGYLNEIKSLLITEDKISSYERSRILIISTGCQGEDKSSTKRIAKNTHSYIKLIPQDTVIFSSKIIPGNENSVAELINLFEQKGINVFTEHDAFIHVSGHPNQEELKEMYRLSKAKIAIPVHGELLHLRQNCKIAKRCNIPTVIKTENGQVVKIFQSGKAEVIGQVPSGRMIIDGKNIFPANSSFIEDRRNLQNNGIATILVLLDNRGNFLEDIVLDFNGVYDFKRNTEMFQKTKNKLLDVIRRYIEEKRKSSVISKFFKKSILNISDINLIERALRKNTKKFFSELLGKRPVLQIYVKIVER